ncbi:hypothetical protein B0O99DRAFT_478778, partial [Bisporella sp. PMI_857]
MHSTLALVGALASVAYASPMPQAVTETITPTSSAPTGFSPDYSGKFEITAVNSTVAKRDLEKRTCNAEGSLTLSLAGGVLTDAKGRIGYIADNYQFQFDGPPQAGAIYTGGFSVGSNGSLALGGSAIFYQCLSGTFYNLYDRYWAPQCDPILITILPCSSSSGNVGQVGDGQVTGTGAVIPPVTQIADGQIQGSTAIPVSELPDGQPNVPTGLVSQIADGQIQNPTAAPNPVTQIGDGQVQAPTATATAGPVISQIGDGQVQAPTGTVAPTPITQIGDGQIQAPTGTAPIGGVITQIGDGQIQAPNATVTTPAATPVPSDIAGSGASGNII